jgi:hypothetical protein
MTRPVPATIENSIRERLSATLHSAIRYADPASFSIKSMLNDAEKLIAVDPPNGSLVKAEIYHLCGDIGQFDKWLDNARRLGAGPQADRSAMYVRSNLGYFSASVRAFEQLVVVESGVLSDVFAFGLVICSYRRMGDAAASAAKAKMELGMDSGYFIDTARKGVDVLNKLGINEGQVQSVLDVAGEVLRRHNLFWMERGPVVRFSDAAESPGLLYQMYVGVPPAEALQLTDEVLELLFERDLYLPGLAFTFISHPSSDAGH